MDVLPCRAAPAMAGLAGAGPGRGGVRRSRRGRGRRGAPHRRGLPEPAGLERRTRPAAVLVSRDVPDVWPVLPAGGGRPAGPPVRHPGWLPVASPAAAQVIAPESAVVPTQFWRRRILSGRLPDPARPDEVDISFTLAQTAHLAAGATLRTTLLTPAGRPVPVAFRVVGIDAAPQSSRRRPGRAPTQSGRPRPSTGRTAPASTSTPGWPSGSGAGPLTCPPSSAS
jgi:hypothetical protein